MDTGGSFLELACIRIAILPAGPMTNERFVELANHIDIVHELPSNALPKPQANPRRTFLGGMSAMAAATFSHAPAEFRAAQQQQGVFDGLAPGTGLAVSASLVRSRSTMRDGPTTRTNTSLSPSRSNSVSVISTGATKPIAGVTATTNTPAPNTTPTAACVSEASEIREVAHATNENPVAQTPPASDQVDSGHDATKSASFVVNPTDSSSQRVGVSAVENVGEEPTAAATATAGDGSPLTKSSSSLSTALPTLSSVTVSPITQAAASKTQINSTSTQSSPLLPRSMTGPSPTSQSPSSVAAVPNASTSSTLASRFLSSTPFGIDRFAHILPSQRTRWSNMSISDPDAGHVRLRYDIIHRDASGSLMMKPPSEWDNFHSRRTWGVIGVVDCADPEAYTATDLVDKAIAQARVEFAAALSHFRGTIVSRLIVFTTSDAVLESGTFVTELGTVSLPNNIPNVVSTQTIATSALSSVSASVQSMGSVSASVLSSAMALLSGSTAGATPANTSTNSQSDQGPRPVVVGYVPMATPAETRLEVRAQVIHFVGVVLSSLETWMNHESVTTDVFLSPLDEHTATDNKSKLEKRRQGRLEKVQGDYYLLTGFAAESLAKYNSAIERAKANSDSLWLAGAMEGAAAAQVYVHVAAGNAADDPLLTDRLIEQFAEIYRLYRRKHVAELEACAALRLAEYLGRWTNRRKDAIEAANQAATVGKDLRSAKRQSLWESLARFFEAMGCRRKAALYLYRLGQLDASQDVWSKAHVFLTASARQFNGRKCNSWPSLHRRVLLEAAFAAREAGDSVEAARHSVEALAISPNGDFSHEESDSEVVRQLLNGPVPHVMKFAERLVTVLGISARQLPSLSIRVASCGDRPLLNGLDPGRRSVSKDPFIYNPFEARIAAAMKAEASRVVTWVCEETAHVSLCLKNHLQTSMAVDIVAIAILAADEIDSETAHLFLGSNASVRNEIPGAFHRLPSNSSLDQNKMKALVRALNRSITTVSQNTVLPSGNSGNSVIVDVPVVPHRAGQMNVHGVVLRLFSGTHVLLHTPEYSNGNKLPLIEIMEPVPKLHVTLHSSFLEPRRWRVLDVPISLYEGEIHMVRAVLNNPGPDDISSAILHARVEKPDLVSVFSVDDQYGSSLGEIQNLCVGESRVVDFKLYASRPAVYSGKGSHARNGVQGLQESCSLSLAVEYIGKRLASHYRTTSADLSLNVAPAISMDKISLFVDPRHDLETSTPHLGNASEATFDKSGSGSCVSVELCNRSSSPILVYLCEGNIDSEDFPFLSKKDERLRPSADSFGQSWIEQGGSSYLMHKIHGRVALPESPSQSCAREGTRARYEGHGFLLQWEIPAAGRFGLVPIFKAELEGALQRHLSDMSMEEMPWRLLSGHAHALKDSAANITIDVADISGTRRDAAAGDHEELDADIRGQSRLINSRQYYALTTRRFYDVLICVQNTSGRELPSASSFDIKLCQRDCRGLFALAPSGVLIGAHEGVPCGQLAPGNTMKHAVRMRVSSSGFYDLVVILYNDELSLGPMELHDDLRHGYPFGTEQEFSDLAVPPNDPQPNVPVDQDVASLQSAPALAGSPMSLFGMNGIATIESFAAQKTKTHAAEASKVGLRRVGPARRKKPEEGKLQQSSPSSNVAGRIMNRTTPLQPLDGATFADQSISRSNTAPVTAGVITLLAANDTRWNHAPLRPLAYTAVSTPLVKGDARGSLEPVAAEHHGPDTIVQ